MYNVLYGMRKNLAEKSGRLKHKRENQIDSPFWIYIDDVDLGISCNILGHPYLISVQLTPCSLLLF